MPPLNIITVAMIPRTGAAQEFQNKSLEWYSEPVGFQEVLSW